MVGIISLMITTLSVDLMLKLLHIFLYFICLVSRLIILLSINQRQNINQNLSNSPKNFRRGYLHQRKNNYFHDLIKLLLSYFKKLKTVLFSTLWFVLATPPNSIFTKNTFKFHNYILISNHHIVRQGQRIQQNFAQWICFTRLAFEWHTLFLALLHHRFFIDSMIFKLHNFHEIGTAHLFWIDVRFDSRRSLLQMVFIHKVIFHHHRTEQKAYNTIG